MAKKSQWAFVLPALISVAMIWALFLFVDVTSFVSFLDKGDPIWIAASALIFFIGLLLRAWRFRYLLAKISRQAQPFRCGYDTAVVSNLLNHLLPLRLGELSFLFLASVTYRVPTAKAAVALLLARLYDLIVLLVLLVVGMVWVSNATALPWLIASGALTAALLFSAVRLDLCVAFGRWCATRILSGPRSWQTKMSGKVTGVLDKLADGAEMAREWRLVVVCIAISLGIWAALLEFFSLVLTGFGLPLPFERVMVGSAGATLLPILPINAFGSLGTLEAGWSAGFVWMGLSQQDAVASGFAMHIIVIGVSLAAALFSLLRLGPGAARSFQAWRKDVSSG